MHMMHWKKKLPLLVMGCGSMLMQTAVLRQLLSVFSGNELDIGITLAVWLSAAGIGSFVGRGRAADRSFALSFIVLALLVQPSISLAALIRQVFGLMPGETVQLGTIVLSTVIVLLPICFVIGFQFPSAVAGGFGSASEVYGYEAAGAFVGGALYTFVLAGRVDALTVATAWAVIYVLTGSLLLGRRPLLIFAASALVLHMIAAPAVRAAAWKGSEVIGRTESRYGEIVVTRLKEQKNVYVSGKYHFSYPDRQTEELKTHLPMSVHPAPERVLVIGGSPALIRESLRYSLSGLDFVEPDTGLLSVSLSMLDGPDSAAANDRRVSIINEDARKYIKKKAGEYDLIIVNLPEPSTGGLNRFYTADFFSESAGALKEGGMLALCLPTASGYIGKRLATANGAVLNALRTVFKQVAVSSEEYGLIIGSGRPFETSPNILAGRLTVLMPVLRHLGTHTVHDAFSPLKSGMVMERLGRNFIINRDDAPVAYLYNLMLWAEVHGGRAFNLLIGSGASGILLMLSVILVVTGFIMGRRGRTVAFAVFTTGWASMGFSVLLILSYQAAFGYVYERIGLLNAIFMTGMAAGSLSFRSGPSAFPVRRLILAELGLMAVICLYLSGFRIEWAYYAFMFFCGAASGLHFSSASRCLAEGEAKGGAGRIYAADLAGACIGALTASIALIPLLGIQKTVIVLVFLKVFSAVMLMLSGAVSREGPSR